MAQMTPHPRLSRAGIDLVKRFEGFRRRAGRLDGGGWTIGYGHTASAREGVEVTEDQAEALLVYDLDKVAHAIDPLVFTPLNRNQFNALVAFSFNVGVDNFRRSAVLGRLNEGAYLRAAGALELWRRAEFQGQDLVVDALVRRRAAEKVLFLTPDEGFRPVPTPVLRPSFDGAAAELIAQGPGLADAAELDTTLEGDRAFATRIGDTALEDSARDVSARLQELFPEPAPAPAVDPHDLAAPPFPVVANEAEPSPEPEPAPVPEPTPEPALEPAPEPVLEPEAPPQPEPVVEVEPPPAPPALEPAPPPLAEMAALSPRLFEPPPRRLDPGAFDSFPEPPPELPIVDFGRRAMVEAAPAPTPQPAPSYVTLLAGAAGALMFIGALLAMVYGKATLVNLAVGLVGVLCMVPAGLRLLLGLFGEGRDPTRS